MAIQRLRLALLALTALAAVTLSSCGTDDEPPEAQPSTDSPAFVEGVFDEVPRMPASDAVAERSEKNDVVAQSFEVRNVTPEGVLDWYQANLTGWTQVGDVEKLGVDTYRGTWRRDGFELTVSSTGGPTLSEPGESRSQYSLSLRPA